MRRSLGDFVGATVRGLEYFGAVPEILTCDYVARHIIAHDHARHRVEEPPRRVQASAHRLGGLLERRRARALDRRGGDRAGPELIRAARKRA
jgi:hypothetical protein